MKLMVIGASRGLGRAFVEGLCDAGDTVIGVSRKRPGSVALPDAVHLEWIEADLSQPLEAARQIALAAPEGLDVLICNLGVWEEAAFTKDYRFLETTDASVVEMVDINITGTLLLIKQLMPQLLRSKRRQLILTGSTSALRQSGRPEVAFAASKFALNGMGDALRESFRADGLAVSCLQLGYLNTDDGLTVPLADAAARGEGQLVPVHDVVSVVRTMIHLSPAAYIRELVMPAIGDARF
ncbi:SDR family NAD(P)-dependent oxidoreductase [Kerstersia gyiorum]|jgi:NAD(P)-dependent dehydrogenase (short-subunit alcohol dehydrogenase family)|uniref:SDR family NAD(P)-dependent oxidoreductase n=1 Tax=Kerstersia gyiorum TaxID=206506 RepID=UPI002432CF14|nr:SDR family oxidoreductase [Kerstersia gyiorum]MCH4270701.1 SDR family oxidoreductase [Kerstersia gyiorum]MCI1229529.1 SDR family oxidoreductase [Kerstersia gyiorum]